MFQKTITLLLVMVILSTTLSTSQPIIKCLHPNIDCKAITDFVSKVPSNYTNGVKGISVYANIDLKYKGALACGIYYSSGIIRIDYACDYSGTIYHELKHHYCVTKFKEHGDEGKCFKTKIGLGGY